MILNKEIVTLVYVYLVMVVLICIIGATLLITNPKKKAIQWISIGMLCPIFGAFNALITEEIIPSLVFHNNWIINFLTNLAGFSNTIPAYFIPYSYLMFSVFFFRGSL